MAVEMIVGEVQQFSGDDDGNRVSVGDSNKIDVFSMGVLLWTLWTLKQPYTSASNQLTPFSLMVQLVNGLRPPLPKDMPDSLKQLLAKCWDKDPEVRCALVLPSPPWRRCALRWLLCSCVHRS